MTTFLHRFFRGLKLSRVKPPASDTAKGGADALRPSSNEHVITGAWVTSRPTVVDDAACHRIDALISFYLQKVAVDPTGWETLYRDPRDLRLWEHTYPHSEMHGGGPPQLRVMELDEARAKYGDLGV